MSKINKNDLKKTMSKKALFWDSEQLIAKLKKSLSQNKVSVTSTDTTLGLIANTTFASFKELNTIKRKRGQKPYLVLIWPQEKLYKFVEKSSIDKKIEGLIKKCWPGPVTMIFKAKKGLPKYLQSKEGKIAIRCPKSKDLQAILSHFKGLFSTSANQTDTPPPTNINAISPQILNQTKYLIVNSINFLYKTLPSSIIDVSDRKEIKVVRKGCYPISKLENYYGKKFK